MSDEPFDSPWGDQVSLSKGNSSTSSFDHHDNATAAESESHRGPPTDNNEPVSDPLAGNEDGEEIKKPEVDATADAGTTPAARVASPRKKKVTAAIRTGARAKKGVVLEHAEPVDDPLGPLGGGPGKAGDDDDDDLEDTSPVGLAPRARGKAANAVATGPVSSSTSAKKDEVFDDVDLQGDEGADKPTRDTARVPSLGDDMARLSLGGESDTTTSRDAPVAARRDNAADSITFDITVGDPIKVGDITNAHTVYTVHTKTTAPQFAKSEVSVTRRYRDFRWLFHALEHNNPGIIVPPPPDKQAVGRFNNDFVEQRRLALENMLVKIAKHPRLRTDNDFRLFLESDQFANDIKTRVVSSDELEATQSSGFMGALGGVFAFQGKFIESNPWFSDKRATFDTLETQLKSLSKALDLVITERRELSDATTEFAATLESLAVIEVSRSLSELIQAFSDAHMRIRDVYSRQCMQDMMSLGNTLDEYIRIIGSVRSVFSQRQNLYFSAQHASQDLSKKRASLEKHMRQSRTQQDKIRALEAEVDAQDKKVLNLRVAFDDISKQIIQEVERIDTEKIVDFRDAVELFLENAVEAQKETIEIWETFYQRSFPSE